MRSRIAALAISVLAVVGVGTVAEVTTAPAAMAAADLVFNDGGNGSPIYFADLAGTKRILYPGWSNGGHYGIYQASRVYAPSNTCVHAVVYQGNTIVAIYNIRMGGSMPVYDGQTVHGTPGGAYCNG